MFGAMAQDQKEMTTANHSLKIFSKKFVTDMSGQPVWQIGTMKYLLLVFET